MNAESAERWILEGGTVLEPETGSADRRDVYIADGRVLDAPPSDARRLDCRGMLIMPGAIDLHVHTREPGSVRAETVASATRAAAAGGFTAFLAMPNTIPATDTVGRVEHVLELGRAAGYADVLVSGAITRDRAGHELSDMAALKRAGVVAFTDDGSTPEDEAVMRAAMSRAAALDMPVLDHAMLGSIAGQGQVRDPAAARLGLAAIPADSEIRAVARDVRLARETGCRTHIQHISTAEGVDHVRRARAEGLPVTAEATPHHLALSTTDIRSDDADFKMNPPLGTPEDRDAVIAGVMDGTITALATDHAPHAYAPGTPIGRGAFGIVGLETALAVTYGLLTGEQGLAPLAWAALWTTGPAALLGRPTPSLRPGSTAHAVVFDPRQTVTVDPSTFRSGSRNTPFAGSAVHGQIVLTLRAGQTTWQSSG